MCSIPFEKREGPLVSVSFLSYFSVKPYPAE